MTASGFLPARVKGVDARQKAIFDGAIEAAKHREHLLSDRGATAEWRRRRRGLSVALTSRVLHGNAVHTFGVRLRWRGRTVFQATFHQRLFGGNGRCGVEVFDDVPGEWETLLAGLKEARS